MAVDTIRHLDVFCADKFNPKQVEVIGCGAIGSRVVLGLSKLGIEKIRVWDFDKVEEHNIANQAFGNHQIGQPKAKAIASIVKEFCGIDIEVKQEKVDGSQKLEGVVFMCPDTMKARKEIWTRAMKLQPRVEVLLECRMGKDSCRVYCVDPTSRKDINGYEKSLYDDEETEVSACGAAISVGPTAEFTSALLQWSFIRWFSNRIDSKKLVPESESLLWLDPVTVISNVFQD